MNERPSFYPKHLARQYVSATRCLNRPSNEVKPSILTEKESKKKDFFAPTITSSTIHLPSVKQKLMETENVEQCKSSKVLTGLPDSFVEAMRKLFNLIDSKNEGKIKFEDIANNWSNDIEALNKNLPAGVVESLSRVATQDGFLTFERFCAGIKIAILRQEAALKRKKLEESSSSNFVGTTNGQNNNYENVIASGSDSSNEFCTTSVQSGSSSVSCPTETKTAPPVAIKNANSADNLMPAPAAHKFRSNQLQPPVTYQSPISPIRSKKPEMESHYENHFMCSPLSRTSSLPILPGALRAVRIQDDDKEDGSSTGKEASPSPVPSEPSSGLSFGRNDEERRKVIGGPPKPPRDPARMSGIFSRGSTHSLPTACHPATAAAVAYPNISSYIRNETPIQFIWKEPPPEMRMPWMANCQAHSQNFSIVVDENTKRTQPVNSDIVVLRRPATGESYTAAGRTRRNSLQKGVEATMEHRMKLWEDERSVLEEGLQTLDRVKKFYIDRLNHVASNIEMQTPEINGANLEAMQERCIFDLRNIRDLNQRVGSLMKRSNRDPAQIRSTGEAVDEHGKNNELRVSRLQDQNRKLTDEVYQKSQMITELEEEKRALIRELFQMNSAKAGSATDTIKSSNSVKLNNFRPPLRVVNGVENKYFPSQNHFYNN